jgi:hypothetical protein
MSNLNSIIKDSPNFMPLMMKPAPLRTTIYKPEDHDEGKESTMFFFSHYRSKDTKTIIVCNEHNAFTANLLDALNIHYTHGSFVNVAVNEFMHKTCFICNNQNLKQ